MEFTIKKMDKTSGHKGQYGEKMRRNWIKLWVHQTLRGTLKKEFTYDERWSWPAILLLCGDCPFSPFIAITENVGYTDEQIAGLIDMPLEVWLTCKAKMLKHNKIKVYENNIIRIINWKKYQPEYERQKEYRLKGRYEWDEENKRIIFIELQNEVTDKSTDESDDLEGEGEGEGEGEIEEEGEKKKEKKIRKPRTYDDCIPYWEKEKIIYFSLYEKEWKNISDDYKQDLKEAFPALDIEFQLKKMKGWCLTHQAEVRSRRDWPKFIYNWLNREKPERQSMAPGYPSRKQQIRERTAAAIKQEIKEKEAEDDAQR